MHPSAMRNCKMFFDQYASYMEEATVVDIGSLDVNGSLREVMPTKFKYVGVDFAEGKGVDIILQDPYNLPFEDNSVDIIVSSSCFEHSEMFWLVYLEMLRMLKPNGLLYICAPANGAFHRYPVDCWRFYPDSGKALVTWAKRNSMNPALLESYTSNQENDTWNDFVSVFVKDEAFASNYRKRIVDIFANYSNGIVYESSEFLKHSVYTEDQLKVFGQWNR